MTNQLTATGDPATALTPLTEPYYEFADFLLGLPYSTAVQFGDPNHLLPQLGLHRLRAGRFSREQALHHPIWRALPGANATRREIQPHRQSGYEFHGHRGCVGHSRSSWAVQRRLSARPDSRRLQRTGRRASALPGIRGIKPRTIVRAGYSIFYNQSVYNSLAQKYLAYQPPFDQSRKSLHFRHAGAHIAEWLPGPGSNQQDSEYRGRESIRQAGLHTDLDARHGNIVLAELAARSYLHRNERHEPGFVARTEPRAAGNQPTRDAERAANPICHKLLLRPIRRELHL